MRTYKVEVDPSARADIDELTSWLQARMTLDGAEKYLDAMCYNTLSKEIIRQNLTKSKEINRLFLT